jgi:hypothetical protein
MLELTMCGLVGLAVMLVIAFYFACSDQLSPVRNAHRDGKQVGAFRG